MDNKGEVPNQNRLNWQLDKNGKPKKGRTGNEAVLHLMSDQIELFPDPGEVFNVLADDGIRFPLKMVKAQYKRLQNPMSNSALGLYFRNRIGVPSGTKVERKDLERLWSYRCDIL